jgi:hypothetical protein
LIRHDLWSVPAIPPSTQPGGFFLTVFHAVAKGAILSVNDETLAWGCP